MPPRKGELKAAIDKATTVLVLLVAIGTLVPPAVGKPLSANLNDSDSWWYNACGIHRIHYRHNKQCKLGNVVPKSTRLQVNRSMHNFYNNLQKELQHINSTYAQVMNGFTNYTQPAYDWLPKYRRSSVKSKVILGKYHEDLQKFVVAVHHLTTIKVDTDAEFPWDKRKELLTNLSNNMKLLLCEIETAVNATCQTVPKRIPAKFAQEKGLKHPKTITELYLTDWAILREFTKFMRQSKRLANDLPKHNKESDSDETEETDETATHPVDDSGE